MDAAEAAIQAARGAKTVPQHTFSGPVEHALAHIEESIVHGLPEEQQRWYAIKVFERDDKVLEQLHIAPDTMKHIEADIAATEKELDDDAESIITNERYVYIAQVIKSCYRKHNAGSLSTSDKIDKVVTNRWLGLPIFALVMFAVYWIAMVGVGKPATDWANDGLFGDGYFLFGNGRAAYDAAVEDYGDTNAIVEAFAEKYGVEIDEEAPDVSMSALLAAVPADGSSEYVVQNEDTLQTEILSAERADLEEAAAKYLAGEPDPADGYGTWVPSVPALIEGGLDAIGAADWLKGLILDGIVAGVGAVLGFVPHSQIFLILRSLSVAIVGGF